MPTEGISDIALEDVTLVERAGWRVKLLGRAVRGVDGRVSAYVAPHLIHERHPMAGVADVFNAVLVRGNAVGEVMFYGPGAGKLPTASAVVADVIDAARHRTKRKEIGWAPWDAAAAGDPQALPMRLYLRTAAGRARVEEVFPGSEILAEAEEIALITPRMARCEAEKRAAGLRPCAKLCVLG